MLKSWALLVFGGVTTVRLVRVIWLFLDTADFPVRLGSRNLKTEPFEDSIEICRVKLRFCSVVMRLMDEMLKLVYVGSHVSCRTSLVRIPLTTLYDMFTFCAVDTLAF